jgi:hypothetical protein
MANLRLFGLSLQHHVVILFLDFAGLFSYLQQEVLSILCYVHFQIQKTCDVVLYAALALPCSLESVARTCFWTDQRSVSGIISWFWLHHFRDFWQTGYEKETWRSVGSSDASTLVDSSFLFDPVSDICYLYGWGLHCIVYYIYLYRPVWYRVWYEVRMLRGTLIHLITCLILNQSLNMYLSNATDGVKMMNSLWRIISIKIKIYIAVSPLCTYISSRCSLRRWIDIVIILYCEKKIIYHISILLSPRPSPDLHMPHRPRRRCLEDR